MNPPRAPAIEDLLEHTGFVRSLARGALGRDDLSEDVVQDTWVAALERGPQDPRAARRWLYRVVTNRVASLRRRDATRLRHRQSARETRTVPTPSDIVEREEARSTLVRALLALPPMYREPLVLKYYEDNKPRDIAKRLALPVETVRTRLRRGIERLRAQLDTTAGGRKPWVLATLPLARLPRFSKPAPPVAWTVGKGACATAVIAALGVTLAVSTGHERESPGSSPARRVADSRSSAPTLATRRADPRPATHPVATAPDRSVPSVLRVVDAWGAPVVNAQVSLAKQVAGRDDVALRVTTNAQGEALLPRVATAADGAPRSITYALRVQRPADRDDVQDLTVRPWDGRASTLRLLRGTVVAGVLSDRQGRTLPGASVTLRNGTYERELRTNDVGVFHAGGLPAGRWHVQITLPGPGMASHDAGTVLGGTRGARIELPTEEAPHRVSIMGYDASHRRTKLIVTELSTQGDAATGAASCAVADEGIAWIYGLRGDRSYALWWHPHASSFHAFVPHVQGSQGESQMRVVRGATLRVQVRLPASFLGMPQLRAMRPGIDALAILDEPTTAQTHAATGDTSRRDYVFFGLPDGVYTVRGTGRDWNRSEVGGETRARTGSSVIQMTLEER